ncbi:PLP-dependent aminotransferase family protein [Clostridium oceanicum]|uniref:PLP-dependent aminotransferase family protein n=1 Tax=Clostridium oceanicum TaxID=1543 RepID=A0ABP3UVH3_9CLOT
MIINWKPDKSIETPLYIQIVDYFINMIKKGYFVAKERFPSQRNLAEIFSVNRSTVVLAMDELKAQGFVITNGKGGTYVSKHCWIKNRENITLNSFLSLGILKRKNKIYKKIEENYSKVKVDFSKGELDESLYPNNTMKKIIAEVSFEISDLSYGNKNGDKGLIKKIKEEMIDLGIDMEQNDILIVSGATQGLFLVALGMISQGNIIKTRMPSYMKSLEIFNAAGLKIEDFSYDKKTLYNAFYMIPTFHNPTTNLMSSLDREFFMNKYGRHNLIIEDDVFRDLWYDSEPPNPLKSYVGGENVIYVNSFSKTLATGLRVGWICASSDIIKKLSEIKSQIDSSTALINQKIVLKWLESSEYVKNINNIRKELKKRRDLIDDILSRDFKDIFLWSIPKGGYYYWIKSKDNIKALDIFERALEYGLLVNPGDLYGEKESSSIRISFASCEEEKIKGGFKILKKVMNSLKYGL